MRAFKACDIAVYFQQVLIWSTGFTVEKQGICVSGPIEGREVLAVGTKTGKLIGSRVMHYFLPVDGEYRAAGSVRPRAELYDGVPLPRKEFCKWVVTRPRTQLKSIFPCSRRDQ